MMLVQACADLMPVLREKLQERRQAIGPVPVAPVLAPTDVPDVEKALRQLMVWYRPFLAKLIITKEELATTLERVATVGSAAEMVDLRLIDSLNTVFEVWDSEFEVEARTTFLAIYGSTLHVLIDS